MGIDTSAQVIDSEPASLSPLAFSPEAAARASHISRTALYQAIREKKLVARKSGRRTLILDSDLRSFLGSLPRAAA
jgi:Helix-turn-helix domain